MAGFTRTIHPATTFMFGKLSELCPDVALGGVNPDGTAVDTSEMMGLVCNDPDGEAHVYLLDATGKKNLLGVLTGGIIVEDRMPVMQ